MSRLEDMQLLVETVDRGSFSAAAARLGLSKQYVSRRIGALEERLGVQLMVRTTRRLNLTALGRDYLERARRILADVDDADAAVSSHGALPRGRLRIAAPVSFGQAYLSPLLARFVLGCPEVQVDVDLSDRTVDLVAEGYDLAVRVGVLPDSTLIARRLMPSRLVIVASPDYLARRGRPNDLEALTGHDALLYRRERGPEWWLTVDGEPRWVPLRGRMTSNNGDVLRDAAVAGLGLAQLPLFVVRAPLEDGRLVRLLEALDPPAGAVWAVTPQHRQLSTAVQAFVSFLRDAMADEAALRDPALAGSPT